MSSLHFTYNHMFKLDLYTFQGLMIALFLANKQALLEDDDRGHGGEEVTKWDHRSRGLQFVQQYERRWACPAGHRAKPSRRSQCAEDSHGSARAQRTLPQSKFLSLPLAKVSKVRKAKLCFRNFAINLHLNMCAAITCFNYLHSLLCNKILALHFCCFCSQIFIYQYFIGGEGFGEIWIEKHN